MTSDAHFMSHALAQAREAELAGEVPEATVRKVAGENYARLPKEVLQGCCRFNVPQATR